MSDLASPISFVARLLTYFLLGIFFVHLLVIEIVLYIYKIVYNVIRNIIQYTVIDTQLCMMLCQVAL